MWGGEHLPALAGWYAASVGNNYATPSLLHLLGGRPLPLNVLEQATMSLLGALSCSRLKVPLPGLAQAIAAELSQAGIRARTRVPREPSASAGV